MKKTTGEKSNKQTKSYLTNIQSFLQAYIETLVFLLEVKDFSSQSFSSDTLQGKSSE